MERPSRTKMLQQKYCNKAQPQTDGDKKVKVQFESGKASLLAIRSTEVTYEFLFQFCKEHGLMLKDDGNYYYLY